MNSQPGDVTTSIFADLLNLTCKIVFELKSDDAELCDYWTELHSIVGLAACDDYLIFKKGGKSDESGQSFSECASRRRH